MDNLKTNHRVRAGGFGDIHGGSADRRDCAGTSTPQHKTSCITTSRHCTRIYNIPPPCKKIQGIYVLQDHSFRWLLRLAPPTPAADGSRAELLARAAQPYLHLPCGLIRGALVG